MEQAANAFVLRGRVTDRHGRAVHRAHVVIWLQNIRDRIKLTECESGKDGRFDIWYTIPEHLRAKPLIVATASSKRLHAPIESPLTEAQPKLQLNLSAETPDTTEFTTLLAAIRPLLGSLALKDLVEDDAHKDLTFLARKTARSPEEIMRLVVAAHLEAGYPPVPAVAFWVFLRQRTPSALPSPVLEASKGFTVIGPLAQKVASLILALSPELQTRTLVSAVATNLIGAKYTPEIPEIVRRLQAHRATDMLERPYVVGEITLGQLLDIAGLPSSRKQAFARALAANSLSMSDFWRTLRDGKHGLTAAQASKVERAVTVGAFVDNHGPLVEVLLQEFSDGTYRQNSDLARLSQADWIRLVDQVGPPPSIGAASSAEDYARAIYTRVTRAFPTTALAARIKTWNFVEADGRKALDRFFRTNPELDLMRNNLTVFLEGRGNAAWTGIKAPLQEQVLVNAKRMQRVLFVTPNVDAAEALLSLGIHSATQIASIGQQQFLIQAAAAGVSQEDAKQTYLASAQRYAGLVSLFMQDNRRALGVWPKSIGLKSALDDPIAQIVQRDPSLVTLFGPQDFCAVDSCTSILSPAAYLCDLLHWLGARKSNGRSVLDTLDKKRPDIRQLLLNCPNTETKLPYIDLVNEILADAVFYKDSPNNPKYKNTTRDQTEAGLRAAPQYFNEAAYGRLAAAKYPHTLPYSAGLDELRICLQQLGVPFWQLRQAILPLNAPTDIPRVSVAAERFSMNSEEVDLVTIGSLGERGVSADAKVVWNLPAGPEPTVRLSDVQTFLRAASLSYESLLELLQVSWVNGIGAAIQGANDTCDTSKQVLVPIDADFLDRAHRFLRLWRRTGYKMWELDLLLQKTSLLGGTLNRNALTTLFSFRQLQDKTNLPVDAQLAFFQNMDTAAHREPDGSTAASLYARTFLNPSVPPDQDLLNLVSIPFVPLLNNSLNTNTRLAALAAALEISQDDAGYLVNNLTDNTLTLDNLSFLYRIASLARAAQTKITDLVALAGLLSPRPLLRLSVTAQFRTPTETLEFFDKVQTVGKTVFPFTIDALTYLLTPPAAALPRWPTATGMKDADIHDTLVAVCQAIHNSDPTDPTSGDSLVIGAVAGAAGRDRQVTQIILQHLRGGLPGAGQLLLEVLKNSSLAAQVGPAYAGINLHNLPGQYAAVQLFDKAAIVASGLSLVNSDLLWLVTNDAALYGGLDFGMLPVTAGQVATLDALLATVLMVSPSLLFTATGSPHPPRLWNLIANVGSASFVSEQAAQTELAAITAWPAADIADFAGALGLQFPDDYKSPRTYDRLRVLAKAATTTRATGSQLVRWATVPLSEGGANGAKSMGDEALGVLKSRYSAADWLAFAPKIMDPWRENRAAALQDYLIAQRDPPVRGPGHDLAGDFTYGDVNGLFDHFLIDTRMSACETTTRVVQAYVAVQIFVERCRMNLEAPQVVVKPSTDDAWNNWEWMKRYQPARNPTRRAST